MKALIFEQFGDPAQVLQLKDVPAPQVGPGQVRVRMLAAPVNPSDVMVIRGRYGRLPALPATPGFEGVGVVEEAGSGFLKILRGLKPGKRVAVLHGQGGSWQEQVVLSARHVVPLPSDLPDEQAASFFVNPATALIMTRYVLGVGRGQWLLQTAAGSALGRMVIRLGQYYGFRTINLVRRREQADDLKKLGADAVVCTADEDVAQRVQALTGGQGVPFALDAVGGPLLIDVLKTLGRHGRALVYGTLANEPAPLDPRLLIGGEKRLDGFWLSEWVKDQGALRMLRLFRKIKGLLRAGVLTTNVGPSFPLAEYQKAMVEAERPGHGGKVLLRISS
jgi:NADPH:quinone reductase-like Zn-dependent oxidoreductase